jgi:hypothetical protein
VEYAQRVTAMGKLLIKSAVAAALIVGVVYSVDFLSEPTVVGNHPAFEGIKYLCAPGLLIAYLVFATGVHSGRDIALWSFGFNVLVYMAAIYAFVVASGAIRRRIVERKRGLS